MSELKLPELPFSPYLVSEWVGPEMTERKTWTAYSEAQMRAEYERGYEAGYERRDIEVKGALA
jgi:hypothetical protein